MIQIDKISSQRTENSAKQIKHDPFKLLWLKR